MNILLVWLLCLGYPSLAAAASAPGPEMFAFGSPLELQGNSPFYYCDLPLDIYQSTTRQDLGDLRVFNSQNQVVPHVLKKAPPQPSGRSELRADLPFFPLTTQANQSLADLAFKVKNTAAGTSIDLQTTTRQTVGPQTPEINGYLLDTAPLISRGTPPQNVFCNRPPATLELEWSDPQNHYLGNIQVDSSTDLVTWRPLTTATLAQMDHQGYRLKQNKITLPANHLRYLRLLWAKGQSAITVSRATLLTGTPTALPEPPDTSWLHAKVTTSQKTAGQFSVDLGGAIPVERLRVKLPGRNSLSVATISAAQTETGPYTKTWQGLLYNLVSGNAEILNPEIILDAAPRRYWRINFAVSEADSHFPPEISYAWRPGQLFFLAQGEGPFRVLYGSPDIQPTDFKMDSLLSRYQGASANTLQPALAHLGPRFVQNAAIKLPTSASLPWHKYTLWLVLTFGVTLIGWMSISLYRQLKAANNDPNNKQT